MARKLKLDNECCVGTIVETSAIILDAIRSAQEVVVDLSGVERIDTAGIQLLLAARREADCLGITLVYSQSAAVQEFASLIGASL